MIQDIAPHKWDITYKNIQPDPDSRVLFFSRGQLLVKQVEHYTDYEKRMVLARKFIEAAADNIYRNLRYYKWPNRCYLFWFSNLPLVP